jgi:hypothetical protein
MYPGGDGGGLVLDAVASVRLDGAGNGSVRLGPTSTRQTWRVTLAVVRVSTNVLEPTANLYQNTRSSSIGGTYTGSNDQSDLDLLVRNGFILCDWAGGDAGAVATLNLHGQILIGG